MHFIPFPNLTPGNASLMRKRERETDPPKMQYGDRGIFMPDEEYELLDASLLNHNSCFNSHSLLPSGTALT
jgi:hypothetical protein